MERHGQSYAALGGAPDQLETTDLEDESQTFVPGVQSMDAMEFTANYTLAAYTTVKAKAGKALKYRLKMGKDGVDGVATWDGQHAIYSKLRLIGGKVVYGNSKNQQQKLRGTGIKFCSFKENGADGIAD